MVKSALRWIAAREMCRLRSSRSGGRSAATVRLRRYRSCVAARALLAGLALQPTGRGGRRIGDDWDHGKEKPAMTKKPPDTAKRATTVVSNDPEDRKGTLKTIG